jgi:hypothetical protein
VPRPPSLNTRYARALVALFIGVTVVAAAGVARAQPGPVEQNLEPPAETVAQTLSATWPLTIDVHALIGAEPHDRGTAVAFGAGMEMLWRARLGGFAELLASEGTPIIPPTINGLQQRGFADRISIPFGLAARPLSSWVIDSPRFWARVAAGVGVQFGITVEHLRTSDDSQTTAGLHAALGLEVPIYGGPRQGGVSLRFYGRIMFTPSVTLDNNTVFEPVATGQIYGGVAYYP